MLALGTVEVGGLIQIPPGLPADLRAALCYRFFSSDDSQSAGNWVDVDTPQSGPGKSFKQGTVPSVTGLQIQLGLKMYTSAGTHVGRGMLSYPMVITK